MTACDPAVISQTAMPGYPTMSQRKACAPSGFFSGALPYMTSAQRGEGGQKILQTCGQTVHNIRTKVWGVKKSEKCVDVIYGIPPAEKSSLLTWQNVPFVLSELSVRMASAKL